ncbi:MAG: putative aminohydrolase SsnA [Candidatus Cloacimonetes bacterium]|nr:putative aminohydrolase SsnA [Candidatus Cloacimonadota bacterium]
MDRLLIKAPYVISFDESQPVMRDVGVLINDGIIERIAPSTDFDGYEGDILDAEGRVLLPGLINAHHHFYSTLVRGYGKAKPSKDFVEVLNHLWWRLDKQLRQDDVYLSALLSILDAIRHGTTTIIDHHASPGFVTGSLSAIAKAVKETGIRGCLCYEVSDRDGQAVSDAGIEENYHWLQQVNNAPDPFLKGLFGMHAAFTLEDRTLRRISQLVHELNCGAHIHVAEALSDQQYNINHHGKRVVERLHDFGLIGDRSIAAHCVHINAREMMLLAETRTAVVTNPQSNLNNAVGIADLVRMSDLGVTIGLGTDAMTTNMLEELRVGLWAQHLKQDNPSCAFMEVTNTLVRNNPLIANRYWNGMLGSVKSGKAADLILIDYQPPTPLNDATWMGHLVFGLSQAIVDTTICAGRILMWNKQLSLDLDEAEITSQASELASRLWDRM